MAIFLFWHENSMALDLELYFSRRQCSPNKKKINPKTAQLFSISYYMAGPRGPITFAATGCRRASRSITIGLFDANAGRIAPEAKLAAITQVFLGLIPWGYVSTADGFSQALDGTWDQYRRETGNVTAQRSNFADAIDFVGWYYAKSAALLNIPRDDIYHLYLAYYLGWDAYQLGAWRENPGAQRHASLKMAADYASQLQQCAPQSICTATHFLCHRHMTSVQTL